MTKNTEEEQDKHWRRYLNIKHGGKIIILLIAGVFLLGQEVMYIMKSKRNSEKFMLNRNERITKLTESPNENFYLRLSNKYKNVNLKVTEWSEDSISFNICQTLFTERKPTWELTDFYNLCNDSLKSVTLSKETLLNANCNNQKMEGSKNKFCQLIPKLNKKNPFKIDDVIIFNGVQLQISASEKTVKSKFKRIALINRGLPITIKKIYSPTGETVRIPDKHSLPYKLETDLRFELDMPQKKKMFGLSYHPIDLKIVIEIDKNREELYHLTLKDKNTTVDYKHLNL